MKSLHKKLFIGLSALLVFSLISGGTLWYQLDRTEMQLDATEVQLNNTKAELEVTKVQLDTTKTELETTEAQLGSTKMQLDATEVQLNNTKAELEVTKVQLDTTKTELETTKAELGSTKTQLKTAEARLEATEREQAQMLNRYSDLRKQINVRVGKGQDAQTYVTPEVSAVSTKVQEITGGYSQNTDKIWQDYERMYRWAVKNINYAVDSYTPIIPENMNWSLTWAPEFWRMPAETLKDKAGDCEDMATLLVSMLLSYNKREFAVWALGIQSRTPEYKGHLAVAFPVQGGRLAILDPAGNYYTGYRYGGLQSDDVTRAVNDWLSHWAKDMPGAQIYFAFSNKFYREFSGTSEFLQWVSQR